MYARTLLQEKQVRKRYVKILYKHLVGFSGCKQVQMNVWKRLKHITPPPPQTERQVFGANIQILRKKKFWKKTICELT